jgi:pyroglutamyl-peptidase
LDRKKILLTGFEPFGGSEVNPSILACRKLEGREIEDFLVVVEKIPLRFKKIRKLIEELVDSHDPAAVVCTGQAGGTSIELERVAINVADARIPYNCGFQPVDDPLNTKGSAAYFTKLPLRSIERSLKAVRIPVVISNSAGTFGCNQIFYHLMDHLARKHLDIPAGFIHVPSLPEQVVGEDKPSMSLDLIVEALEVTISTIISHLT